MEESSSLQYFYETFVDMEKLTPQEEDAMLAVWQVGNGFIKDFIEVMPEPKQPYTTIASVFKNLEKKGFLKSEKQANAKRYSPAIREADYKKKFLSNVVTNYFQNSYKEVVAFFAKDKKVSAEELKEIINLIENSKK